jgi:hypothetical protein
MKAADVRFYIDADLLGLAKVLGSLRSDVTFPGDPGAIVYKRERPACIIAKPDTPDTEWLPLVAAQDWLIISRDHNIRENPAERRAVVESGARMVALAGEDAGNKWTQLELVMRNWRKIEALLSQPGPFIYSLTYTRLTSLDLRA